ncbi:UMP kinase [Kangiella koreensis]|uniref:Uridylate kinase n=1 Tax=Kangiella koreensis (strain DSM 16069 / JCM 12317 / KCTC 12182 / SW-125) TaxID=523791 RepID=C7R692_KANKD|nr:UMP kinase [Kangiella koreensis]ACV27320.1 uridylate kinase [Kangiella koreensis DSM 16069]
MTNPAYKRILLKLSGEALMGQEAFGIDPSILERMAKEIKGLSEQGIEIGVVLGGGNIYRGQKLSEAGMNRVTGDHMGMLATVMNSLALQDAFERVGQPAKVLSAMPIDGVCQGFSRRGAINSLEKGRVVIFCAGTGSPFFTTDTAACLRGIEIDADLILKATKVDGVYSADPAKDKNAVRYEQLSYKEALDKELAVMDLTAFCLARDHNKNIRVFDMTKPGNLEKAVLGHAEGTLIHP